MAERDKVLAASTVANKVAMRPIENERAMRPGFLPVQFAEDMPQ